MVQADLLPQVSDRTLWYALETAGMGIWQRDLRTNRCVRSRSVDAMFGFAPEEVGDDAAPFQKRVHPDDRAPILESIERAARLDGPVALEFRTIHPDGDVRWILARGEVSKDPAGNPERIVTVMMDITTRKRAEEVADSKKNQLQAAIDAADLGLWEHNIIAGTLYWSDRLKTLYGLPPDAKVHCRTFERGLHPEDRDRVLQTYRAALNPAGGGYFKVEHRVVAPDGKMRWLLGSGRIVFDGAGKPIRSIGTALDITDRKQSEQVLARREARLRFALDAARLGTYERELTDEVGHFSPRGAELHGMSTDWTAYTLDSWLQTVHPDDRLYVAECVARSLAGTGTYQADYRVIVPEGQVRWLAGRGAVIKDESDKPVRVAGIVQDITERKQAEEALRTSEQWMRLTMASARVGSWSWDARTNAITYSDWLLDLFELPRGKTFPLGHLPEHPDDYERGRIAFETALAEHRDYDVEFRLKRSDGTFLWVRAMGSCQYDPAGQPVQMFGIAQDITERKRAEEAITAGETRLRLITDSVPGAISYVDAQRRFNFVNATFLEWYGIPREQIVGRPVRDVLGAEDSAAVTLWGERALKGEDVVFERTMKRPGRPSRHLLVHFFPDRDTDGTVLGFYALAIDITERKQAEERLKLLAGEVDHRAKNMLALVQIMLRQTRAASIKEFVDAAQGRISALARAHVVLSERRWEGADLKRLIEEELAPYRAHAPARVAIEGPTVALSARAAQSCAMALHELATNAAKYGALSMPGGHIECTWTVSTERGVTMTWAESGGPRVAAPARQGFGMNVIRRSIHDQLEGNTQFEWREQGLRCTMVLPASTMSG